MPSADLLLGGLAAGLVWLAAMAWALVTAGVVPRAWFRRLPGLVRSAARLARARRRAAQVEAEAGARADERWGV